MQPPNNDKASPFLRRSFVSQLHQSAFLWYSSAGVVKKKKCEGFTLRDIERGLPGLDILIILPPRRLSLLHGRLTSSKHHNAREINYV